MSDEAVYRETIGDRKPVAYAKQRDVLYFNDSNSGRYSGQIVFESINLGGGSDKYQSWGEAMIVIPYVVTRTTTFAQAPYPWEVGLKNGYYQLIDQIKVEYNNKTVQENQSLLNHYVNFKLLTEVSQEDVQKWGPTIGFVPDDPDSYLRGPAAIAAVNPNPAVAGCGFVNNRDNPTQTNDFKEVNGRSNCNFGYYNRKKACTAFNAVTANQYGYGGLDATFAAAAPLNNIGANISTTSTGVNCMVQNTLNTVYSWIVLAQIRLRDVCDFVDKLPLVKNANIRITISYNSCDFTLGHTAANGIATTFTSYTQLTGNTNPVLLPFTTGNNSGNRYWAAANTGAGAGDTLRITTGVCGNSVASPALPIQQCRIYLPVYEMNPQFEEQILSVSPQKTIYYQDIYQFQFSVANGANINQIITSSQKSPVAIVAMPYPSSSNYTNAITITAAQSPYDSAPATTAPYGYIENFNILLGGKPVFTMNKVYDFESFNDELCKYKAFNGANTNGLSNGLIGFKEFSGAYRYYFCDLSRRLDYLSDASYGINMIGKNSSGFAMDIVVFVIYNKNAVLNLLDGTMLS